MLLISTISHPTKKPKPLTKYSETNFPFFFDKLPPPACFNDEIMCKVSLTEHTDFHYYWKQINENLFSYQNQHNIDKGGGEVGRGGFF